MTPRQYDEFLLAVVIICVFGAMMNVAKFKTRGAGARCLAGAFCTLALAVFLIRIEANPILTALAGAVTFGLLAADFSMRIGKQAKEHRP